MDSKWIGTALMVVLSAGVFGQTVAEFDYLNDPYGDNETYLGLALSRTLVTNTDAPNPDAHRLNEFTADINMRKVDFDKGAIRWNFQNKLVGDLFVLTKNVFKNANNIYRSESTTFSTGLLGWFDATVNLTPSNRKYSLGFGLSAKDYFFGSSYSGDTVNQGKGGLGSYDPHGYYFAAGPSMVYNQVLNRWFMLEVSGSYNLSFWRPVTLSYGYIDPTNRDPHWGHMNLELITRLGFHLSANYSWIINRGNQPNNAKRLDFLLGFRFML